MVLTLHVITLSDVGFGMKLLPINSGGGLIDPDRDSQSEPLPYGIIYTIANIPADSKVFTYVVVVVCKGLLLS